MPPEGLLKGRLLSPCPRDADLASLWWDLRIGVYNKSLGCAGVLVHVPHSKKYSSIGTQSTFLQIAKITVLFSLSQVIVNEGCLLLLINTINLHF